jgi:hypothetical protein
MTRKEYLAHAEECERLANQAKLAAIKQALLTSAGMWRKLATPAPRMTVLHLAPAGPRTSK